MTDPLPPSVPDDARDGRVAAWLAVDPLDDVTRARLVRDALAADEPPAAERRRPRGALLAAAAAIVAMVAIGLAVVASQGGDSTPAAKSAPTPRPATEGSRDAGASTALAPESTSATTSEAGALGRTPIAYPSIGDLGDVSTQARLERAARAALAVPAGSPTALLTGCAASAGEAFGTPIATGTGLIDGRPAVVVVAQQSAGSRAVVAVRGRGCGRAVSVVLP